MTQKKEQGTILNFKLSLLFGMPSQMKLHSFYIWKFIYYACKTFLLKFSRLSFSSLLNFELDKQIHPQIPKLFENLNTNFYL
jgi:hypothetical protein